MLSSRVVLQQHGDLVIHFDDFRHESRRISSTDKPSGDYFSPHLSKLSVQEPLKNHDFIGHRFFIIDGDPKGANRAASCSTNERDRILKGMLSNRRRVDQKGSGIIRLLGNNLTGLAKETPEYPVGSFSFSPA